MINRPWGTGSSIHSLYKYNKKEHKHRLGNSSWKPKDGDLCVCVKHGGDYFYYYTAMRKQLSGVYKNVGSFGAYVFGEKCGELPDRDFHLLLAGELIDIKAEVKQ